MIIIDESTQNNGALWKLCNFYMAKVRASLNENKLHIEIDVHQTTKNLSPLRCWSFDFFEYQMKKDGNQSLQCFFLTSTWMWVSKFCLFHIANVQSSGYKSKDKKKDRKKQEGKPTEKKKHSI